MLNSEVRLLRSLMAAARRRGNAVLTSTRLGHGSDPFSYALAGAGAAMGALYVLGYLDWPGDPERTFSRCGKAPSRSSPHLKTRPIRVTFMTTSIQKGFGQSGAIAPVWRANAKDRCKVADARGDFDAL